LSIGAVRTATIITIFASILAATVGSAYGQEISIICNDTNGNYFSAVRGDRVDCFVYPSEITPDGPGHVIVTDPHGKTVIDTVVDQSGVTLISFIAKKAGVYEITATWNVDGQPHTATGPITVYKKHETIP
jgi:hypothetical protein